MLLLTNSAFLLIMLFFSSSSFGVGGCLDGCGIGETTEILIFCFHQKNGKFRRIWDLKWTLHTF